MEINHLNSLSFPPLTLQTWISLHLHHSLALSLCNLKLAHLHVQINLTQSSWTHYHYTYCSLLWIMIQHQHDHHSSSHPVRVLLTLLLELFQFKAFIGKNLSCTLFLCSPNEGEQECLKGKERLATFAKAIRNFNGTFVVEKHNSLLCQQSAIVLENDMYRIWIEILNERIIIIHKNY